MYTTIDALASLAHWRTYPNSKAFELGSGVEPREKFEKPNIWISEYMEKNVENHGY